MKDFFEELGKYIGETAMIVGNKAGEVIETQKLKSQVRSLTHENTVDLLELGRGVYEQYKSGAVLDEKAEGLCEAISSREESIAEFEEKISAIKGADLSYQRSRKMPELWKDGSKRDGLLPVLWRKDAGGNSG